MERGNKVSTVLNYISNFIEKYLTVPEIYASDIVEIVIMSVAIYYVVLWFRKSRAWVLLKGIFVLVIFMLVAFFFYFRASHCYACGAAISLDNNAMDI